MNLRALLFIVSLAFTLNCFANPADKPQLEQLSWLNGCWKGTGLGGEVQECWVSSSDGVFTSVFQMAKDGKQQFSEIVTIAEFDGVLGMRVKHFDASFNQWASDKGVGVTFPFVEIGEGFIQFDGVRYELVDGGLHVTLDMRQGEEVRQVEFVYGRD